MPGIFVESAISAQYHLRNVTIRATTILVPACLLSVRIPALIVMVIRLATAMALEDPHPTPSSEQIPVLELLLALGSAWLSLEMTPAKVILRV
jgi:hypothetical protein